MILKGAHLKLPPEIFYRGTVKAHQGSKRGHVTGGKLKIAPANLGVDVLFNFSSHVESSLRYEDHIARNLVLV